MSNNFEDFLAEQLKDPKVKREYDELEPTYALIESSILARKKKILSQEIEIGLAAPSLNTLSKLTKGDGKKN